MGCGGSATRTASNAALNFANEKAEINKVPGDATGSGYTGVYDVKIQVGEGKRECWGSPTVRKQMESGALPENSVLDCTQGDGNLVCKYDRLGITVTGYVMKTGKFKLYGEFRQDEKDSPNRLRGQVLVQADFAASGPFSGHFRANVLKMVKKGSARCTYDYPVTGTKRGKSAAQTHTETSPAQASLELASGGKTLARNFSDVHVRRSGGNVEVAGNRFGQSERFFAILHTDGTADLSMKLTDTHAATAFEGPVGGCTYTVPAESRDRVRLQCPNVRGELSLPEGTL
jgi:hypothetical protein